MDSENAKRYKIFKTLDQERRIFGLPPDEIIPAVLIFIIFLIFKQMFFAFIFSVAWVLFMRRMKKGNDSSWLIAIFYWHLGIGNRFLYKMPSSKYVHWIS